MKKFLTITLIILSMMVFVACGGSSKKDKNNSDTTNDEDTTDTSDTETPDDADTSDTETPDDPDTSDTETPDNADTSDTETPDDPDTSDTETPDDSDTDVPATCTGLSVDWSAFTHYQKNTFYVTNEDYDPVLQMQFYQDMQTGAITAGTYDLGSEINSTYETCTECVFIQADLVGEDANAEYSKIYYQKSGELKIDAVDDSNEIKGTISAVFAEATIDTETYETLFVENGSCLEIETANFDSGYEEPCVPQCEADWECGSDGCGGTCGDGCNGQQCSEDHKCVAFSCETITLDEGTLSGITYLAKVTGNAAGDTTLEDTLKMSFFGDKPSVGTIDLASETNANYKTCDECILLLEDLDEDGNPTKIYFQESGELIIEDVKEETYESKGHAHLRLVEVEIGNDYTSTPVAGGKCYNVENMTWDTICVPQCDGKQCGYDGCGGICGTCDGQACSAEGQCVPFSCDSLELGEFELVTEFSLYGSYKMYEAYVKNNAAGDTNVPDRFTMTFYTYDAEEDEWSHKTELFVGSETLADYENDETAILMYEDYNEEEERGSKYFVHESGTLNFTEVKEGTLESKGNGSVRLMEVDTNLVQVAGGKCYNIENMTWDTICIPNCEGKQCGDDGCGGTCGGCGDDESCNAEYQCVADACTTIVLDTENAYYDSYYGSYYMPYTPSAGGAYDEFSLQLYYVDPVVGTHELAGTNYADDSGIFIFLYDETESDDYKTYFQKKGQVIITAYDEETMSITAEFKDIKLQEVTVEDSTYFTAPVTGGKCLSVQNTTFTYTAE
ncbi:hypothetical protein J6Z19_00020 [bacterium]|nr:hypothetical protein [bacterium]